MRYETRTYNDQQVGKMQLVKMKVYEYLIEEMSLNDLKHFFISEHCKKDSKFNQYHFRSKALNTYKIPSETYDQYIKEVDDYFAA
tara:strand:- start:191 stop:445 length:255 start_codon:yes stop_codon:yes gene_type:complete